jgi:protein-disulfide isomerase
MSSSLKLAGILSIVGFLIGCGGGSPNLRPESTQPVITAGSHILGNASARVTIIKLCDFQCPYCKAFHADTEWQIVNDYVNTGKASIAFRNLPLSSIHPYATVAAQAAECAAKVGGNDAFWKYHDRLYSDGAVLDVTSLKQYALDLQLDSARFNSCIDNQETSAVVAQDAHDAAMAGANATPTFFINGKKLVGNLPYSTIKSYLDTAQ